MSFLKDEELEAFKETAAELAVRGVDSTEAYLQLQTDILLYIATLLWKETRVP